VDNFFISRFERFREDNLTLAWLLKAVPGVVVDGEGDDWEYLSQPAQIRWKRGVPSIEWQARPEAISSPPPSSDQFDEDIEQLMRFSPPPMPKPEPTHERHRSTR